MFKKLTGNMSIRTKIIAGMLCLLLAVAFFVYLHVKNSGSEETVTEDVKVSVSDISQSVTAAGEIVVSDEEKISFSTSKTFKAMCVEEGESVKEGQHLIMYSNGTYEDAPSDGFVTSINAPRSGYTASSSNYVMFADDSVMRLDITVPEGEINNVDIGDSAEITVDSDLSKTYTGRITAKKAISTTQLGGSENSSGQSAGSGGGGSSPFGSESSLSYYTVSLSLENDGSLLPGMSAICTITISESKDVMTVPIEAVRFDDEGKAYVVTVNGSETEEVYVTTGISDADNVQITEGLSGDETVRVERKENAG